MDFLLVPSLHGRSIWEDPSFYRLPGQNTIAFSPYTANLAPLCNLTRVTGVFLVSNKEILPVLLHFGWTLEVNFWFRARPLDVQSDLCYDVL